METANLNDRQIVQAILGRDTEVTKAFLYGRCMPLFAAIHSKYYTDCETPVELINEIYLYILTPHRQTLRSRLEDFGFRCSLAMWLKILTENYCRQLFARRIDIDENIDTAGDRYLPYEESLTANTRKLDMEDLRKILLMMPNPRYRRLIELRYVEEKSNEETAQLLGMTMANYYNKHRLAKAQFEAILRKEELL